MGLLSEPLLNYIQNSFSYTLGDKIWSEIFGNLVKSFMRHVVITWAQNIPKKL